MKEKTPKPEKNPKKRRSRIHLRIGLVILAWLVQGTSIAFAQKITLKDNNIDLEKALDAISKQSGVDFMYDAALVKGKKINVRLIDADLDVALKTCFKNLQINYSRVKNTIVLSNNGAPIGTKAANQLAGIDLKGFVLDETGAPLHGATVQISGKRTAHTDTKGYFSIADVDPDATVRISYTGYETITLTAGSLNQQKSIRLKALANMLNETTITGTASTKSIKLDLTNRQHLNLAQALQGTIPGLVLKNDKQTVTEELYDGQKFWSRWPTPSRTIKNDNRMYTSEELRKEWNDFWLSLGETVRLMTKEQWDRFIKRFESSYRSRGILAKTTQSIGQGVYPEMRGQGGFTGATKGMLVVIDGFVQENFPADYPVSNIASIEVLKDPAQTSKWGPQGSNGVILIATAMPNKGSLSISYNFNGSFSRPSNIDPSALRLATTAQVLDYYKETAAKRILSFGTSQNMPALNPALSLLFLNELKKINKNTFEKRWDSLSGLSNVAQLGLMQQNNFAQNHSLMLSGSHPNDKYRYTIIGNYNGGQTEALGSSNRSLSLNTRSNLSLLNKKLNISLLLNLSDNKNIEGRSFSPERLQPYQLLLDENGDYIRDYSTGRYSFEQNQKLYATRQGYADAGANPIEDALSSQNASLNRQLAMQMNLVYTPLQGLRWSTALQYNRNSGKNTRLLGWENSEVRQLYNQYAGYDPQTKTATFYMPRGDILRSSRISSANVNLRSGIDYSKDFGPAKEHNFNISLGFAAFGSESSFTPDSTLYSYNKAAGSGTSSPAFPIKAGESVFDIDAQQILLTPLTNLAMASGNKNRNLSVIGSLGYSYKNLSLVTSYNKAFIPANTLKGYSGVVNLSSIASWLLSKEPFFKKVTQLSTLKISLGVGQARTDEIPARLQASLISYPEWGQSGIVVQGYSSTRREAQTTNYYTANLDLGLWQDHFNLHLNYRNEPGSNLFGGSASYNISEERYFKPLLPVISKLELGGSLTKISQLQALAQLMDNNAPQQGGGYSIANTNSNLTDAIPSIINREMFIRLGFFNDRLLFDISKYQRTNTGLSNGIVQTDASAGFGQQYVFSKMVNQGWEMFVQGKLLATKDFKWTATLNAAYNVNEAKQLANAKFYNGSGYLTSMREGYPTDAMWSYRWAGLNAEGAPVVYSSNGEKVVARTTLDTENDPWRKSDEGWLVYNGRTTPPWNGGFIQDATYKDFFARVTVLFSMGHVMRTYMPVNSTLLDNSELIANRWRKPGDEEFTEVAAMAAGDELRRLAIKFSDNTIAPADFIRLQEVQIGCYAPKKWIGKRIKSLSLSINVRNLGLLWTKNKLGLDPEAVNSDGSLRPRLPVRYGLSLNMNF